MRLDETSKIDFIKAKLAKIYPCFGQGSYTRPGTESPLTSAMATRPLSFALGVNVEGVVREVLYMNDILEGRVQPNNVNINSGSIDVV